jgi:hypothetical protein
MAGKPHKLDPRDFDGPTWDNISNHQSSPGRFFFSDYDLFLNQLDIQRSGGDTNSLWKKRLEEMWIWKSSVESLIHDSNPNKRVISVTLNSFLFEMFPDGPSTAEGPSVKAHGSLRKIFKTFFDQSPQIRPAEQWVMKARERDGLDSSEITETLGPVVKYRGRDIYPQEFSRYFATFSEATLNLGDHRAHRMIAKDTDEGLVVFVPTLHSPLGARVNFMRAIVAYDFRHFFDRNRPALLRALVALIRDQGPLDLPMAQSFQEIFTERNLLGLESDISLLQSSLKLNEGEFNALLGLLSLMSEMISRDLAYELDEAFRPTDGLMKLIINEWPKEQRELLSLVGSFEGWLPLLTTVKNDYMRGHEDGD